jgi:DNA-binding beta-propeller fold protein YncE
MRKHRIGFWAALVFLFAAAAGAAFAGGSGYHLKNKIKLGGEGGWDYITFDSTSGRLYISRATHVMVVDGASGKVVGDIPDTQRVHGIALAPDVNRGFTSNGNTADVTIFDLKTLAVIGRAKTGEGPDAIVYDPVSHRVFTMNGRGKSSTAIDAATGNVAGTIDLGGRPEFAVADGKGHVYVNLEDKSEALELDTQKLTVLHRWPMAPCKEPSGLAIDREHRRLFAGCDNKMMAVIDADSGKVIATPAIGEGVDANGFDPGTQFAFSSNGDGTLTVVHEDAPDKFTVVENVATQRGARTMAVDEKSHDVYLVTADFGPRPAATTENPRPRPPMIPDSFVVLVYAK